jgi:prevent-host-death family protein
MSSKEVGIEEARKRLGDLVTAVQQGTDVVLTRNGKPAARIVAIKEPTVYTVEIQASNAEGTIWQALAPAETVESTDSADQVAADVAQNQNIAEGDNWRVVVWEGDNADTGVDPVAVYEPVD